MGGMESHEVQAAAIETPYTQGGNKVDPLMKISRSRKEKHAPKSPDMWTDTTLLATHSLMQ
jgi:hypothetical protein